MKVYSLAVYKRDLNVKDSAVEICVERDLSSLNYFMRAPVATTMTIYSGPVAVKTAARESIRVEEEEKYCFYSYGTVEGVVGIVITDIEYPARTAQGLIRKVTGEFCSKYPRTSWANITQDSVRRSPNPLPLPELKEYLKKYQDPTEADKIVKIQQELEETKVVVYDSINSLLERGEKIENLVQKSEDLSSQSKAFYTQAKKQNSCCVVM